MKICDRCFEKYDDEEMIEMKEFPDCTICIPCHYQFKYFSQELLIKFINNQPERSKREDRMMKCSLCSTIYQDHLKDGVDIYPECERDPYHMDAVL